MTLHNLFPGVPDVPVFDGPSGGSPSVNVGTQFEVTAPGWVTQIRHLQGNTVNPSDLTWDERIGAIWEVDTGGLPIAIVAGPFTLPAPSANVSWTAFDLPAPFPLLIGKQYKVAVMYPTGGYPAQGGYFSGPDFVYGNVVVPSLSSIPSGQGTYKYTPYANDMPADSFNATSYFSDVTISDVDPASTVKVPLKVHESGLWIARETEPKVFSGGSWVTKVPMRREGAAWVPLG